MKAIIFAILLLLAACTTHQQTEELVVGTTFFPLQELTKAVVGSEGAVLSLVPPGVEPHSFEASPRVIAQMSQANAYVSLGIEFEAFEERLLESLPSSVIIIPSATGIALIEIEDSNEEKAHDEDEDDQGHEGVDPHIWLSLTNAQQMVENIRAKLSSEFPEKADAFNTNALEYTQQLLQLDEEFREELASCEKNSILVTHDAYSYLAKDYGFRTISISGISPEVEPTPGQIKLLVDEAREHNIKYIFFEELVDPRVANTIAREVGAKTLVLSPIEGGEKGATFLSLMRENKENLKIAMEC